MRTKKFFAVLISVLVLVAAVAATQLISTGAAVTQPELDIGYANLSMRNSVCIKYAVSSNVSDVELLVWNSPQTEYTKGTEDLVLKPVGTQTISGSEYIIFDHTLLTAKQMADVVYARAYAEVSENGYYSAVEKYSILQYAYNKLGKTAEASSDGNLKEMLGNMLVYGASAQKYLDYNTDRLASADWYQVKVTDGSLDDGCTHGLYLEGDTVTLTAPETDGENTPFSYWADSNGTAVGTTAVFTLTVGTKNEEYTPVYGNETEYSEGLEYESNGDGTCIVLGMGTFEGTELVIPPVSPHGDAVTEIDASAFAGEAFTSVSFPATLTYIGRRAFNGCSSITDVYFDGSEEEWANNVEISTYNSPIENAQMHFKTPETVKYTVTFLGKDGVVLKTESVEEGMSAIAPDAPEVSGYTFTGWDKSFDNVTAEITVNAVYVQISGPTVIIGNGEGKSGDQIEIGFDMYNCPEVYGMSLNLTYDDTVLELVSAASGNALSDFTYTAPSRLKNGCNFIWYANDATEANGRILNLVFKVINNAETGSYPITVTYDADSIYDKNDDPVILSLVNGNITVTE